MGNPGNSDGRRRPICQTPLHPSGTFGRAASRTPRATFLGLGSLARYCHSGASVGSGLIGQVEPRSTFTWKVAVDHPAACRAVRTLQSDQSGGCAHRSPSPILRFLFVDPKANNLSGYYSQIASRSATAPTRPPAFQHQWKPSTCPRQNRRFSAPPLNWLRDLRNASQFCCFLDF